MTTTTVSQPIKKITPLQENYFLPTSCGMGNSVNMKVLAAPLIILCLSHGLVWSFPIQQMIVLKYAYVVTKVLTMKTLQLNY